MPPDEPREERLDTLAGQVAAIDSLVALAKSRIQVFDRDLSEWGWQRSDRVDALAAFLRGSRAATLDVIVHETRWIEQRGARLLALLRTHSHAFRFHRTGPGAEGATDALVIVDGRHALHRYHVDQPRATLTIADPVAVRPRVSRFEEIWATGEPGVTGTVLGL